MADEPKQHELEITEQTFALIREADRELAAAKDRHQLVLAATLAAANIPQGRPLRHLTCKKDISS